MCWVVAVLISAHVYIYYLKMRMTKKVEKFQLPNTAAKVARGKKNSDGDFIHQILPSASYFWIPCTHIFWLDAVIKGKLINMQYGRCSLWSMLPVKQHTLILRRECIFEVPVGHAALGHRSRWAPAEVWWALKHVFVTCSKCANLATKQWRTELDTCKYVLWYLNVYNLCLRWNN